MSQIHAEVCPSRQGRPMKTPNPDAMRLAADWLDHQAAAADLRAVDRERGVPVNQIRRRVLDYFKPYLHQDTTNEHP